MNRIQQNRKKRRKQKKNRTILLLLVIAAVLGAVALKPGRTENAGETVTVSIEQGSSTGDIADILSENGVISSKLAFLLRVNFSHYKGKLKYGDFELKEGMEFDELMKALTDGTSSQETVTLTIPEGFSVEKIITRCVENGLSTRDELEAALNKSYDFEFLKYVKDREDCKYRLQGFLFPSTYEFFKTASAEDIIGTMLSEFEKQYTSLTDNFTGMYETVTKASLIEREAKVDEERARIAGVIENRLKKNMLLQIDATVVYAVSNGEYNVDRVLYKDLETDSPYNTYKYKGLPAGPICSPGLKSIEAALKPEEHSYLYYRTDTEKKDGSHIFTETFEQHTSANK